MPTELRPDNAKGAVWLAEKYKVRHSWNDYNEMEMCWICTAELRNIGTGTVSLLTKESQRRNTKTTTLTR